MKVVVDSSAILAVLFNEADAPEYLAALTAGHDLFMSTGTRLELHIVASARIPDGEKRVTAFLKALPKKLTIKAMTVRQAKAAMAAFSTYGKGRHPAPPSHRSRYEPESDPR